MENINIRKYSKPMLHSLKDDKSLDCMAGTGASRNEECTVGVTVGTGCTAGFDDLFYCNSGLAAASTCNTGNSPINVSGCNDGTDPRF